MELSEKIVLYLESNSKERNFRSFIGEAQFLEKALNDRDEGNKWPTNSKILQEDKFGKFEIDDKTIYIIPSSQFILHTHQQPLVVIKDDEVIDIDEFWYTEFKNTLCNDYDCFYTKDLKKFESVGRDSNYTVLDCNFLGKFTKADETLYAIKTKNITFNYN